MLILLPYFYTLKITIKLCLAPLCARGVVVLSHLVKHECLEQPTRLMMFLRCVYRLNWVLVCRYDIEFLVVVDCLAQTITRHA
jgi:hypothetical protein